MLPSRIIPYVYAVLGFLILLLVSLYGLLVFRMPDYNGSLIVEKIQRDIEIYRDDAGMPHIVAASDEDAYFGLGFAMAQDRLFQMDLLRRASRGRLSEVLGEATLRTDILFRTITAPLPPEQILEKMPPEIHRALEAFAEGVNLAMQEQSLPAEFLLLGYEPEPWKPVDCLGVFYIMSWDLSPAFSQEILFGLLSERLSPVEMSYLFPDYVDQGPDILTAAQAEQIRPQLKEALLAHADYEALMGTEGAGASNNWVVSPEKSATGTAIVANDMHLGHGIPGIWYQAHLISPDLNVTGVLLPGVPFVIVGGNEHTARGFTNVMLDDVDFYLERLDPDNQDRVMYRGGYTDIRRIETEIQIKDREPVKHTIRMTPHGPIISDIHPLLTPGSHSSRETGRESRPAGTPIGKAEGKPEGKPEGEAEPLAPELIKEDHVIAMRWTLYDQDEAAIALYKANRAKDIDEIEEALKYFNMPAQNWVYADSKGNIGYTAAAGIPIRRGFSGMQILRGWDGSQEWAGYVPDNARPRLRNPKQGWIATANNRHSRNYPHTISNYYATPDRYIRIKELLESTDGLDIKDHQRLHMDVLNAQARLLMPMIRKALNEPIPPSGDERRDRTVEYARNTLLDWDLQNDRDSKAAVVYHYLILTMVQEIYRPLMGEVLYGFYVSNRYSMFNSFRTVLQNAYHPFYGKDGAENRTRDAFIRWAFPEAMVTLEQRHGLEAKWGDIHRLEYRHPFGRKSPFLGFFFNRGPYPLAGSWTTVAPAGFKILNLEDMTFDVVHGASQRMIYDVGNPDSSVTTLPAGISGQFLSPHYDDQIGNYIRGKYRHSPLSVEAVKKSAIYRFRLLAKNASN